MKAKDTSDDWILLHFYFVWNNSNNWFGSLYVCFFAGASQFIALQMLMNNANGYKIVLTTFFVNLRHILMGTYLSRFYRGVVKRFPLVSPMRPLP